MVKSVTGTKLAEREQTWIVEIQRNVNRNKVREREREREKQRERDRRIDRQTDRQTDSLGRDRQTKEKECKEEDKQRPDQVILHIMERER